MLKITDLKGPVQIRPVFKFELTHADHNATNKLFSTIVGGFMLEFLQRLSDTFLQSKPDAVKFFEKLGWLSDFEFTHPAENTPVINITTNMQVKKEDGQKSGTLYVRDMSFKKMMMQPGFM